MGRQTQASPTFAKQSLTKLFYQVWPNHLWPTPTLAKLSLATTKFGQSKFGQHHLFVFKVVVVVVGWEGRGEEFLRDGALVCTAD